MVEEKEGHVGCPNPECRRSMENFIRKMNMLLFGADEGGGWSKRFQDIEICMRGKVSRGWLIGTAITVVGVLVVIFVPIGTGTVRTINEINTRNTKMEVRVESHDHYIKEMRVLLSQSEERIKEHIDLLIKAHKH